MATASPMRQARSPSVLRDRTNTPKPARGPKLARDDKSSPVERKIPQVAPHPDRERLEAERRDLHDSQSRKRYNEAARAFNEEVADFQRDLDAINALKARYAENCAGRDYRRADLNTLPEAQQKAMRRGLDDITVPYAAADTEETEGSAR